MRLSAANSLTYILVNGDERTVTLEKEKLSDFVKWYQDAGSINFYDIVEGIGEKKTLFKDTILAVRY